jgi:hypothetical protein
MRTTVGNNLEEQEKQEVGSKAETEEKETSYTKCVLGHAWHQLGKCEK